MNNYKIGDKVTTVDGVEGKIEDILRSTVTGQTFYEIDECYYTTDQLTTPENQAAYEIKVDIADNVVVAVLYEARNGERKEIARNHGHVIHEGALGISQAASYALNRMWQRFDDDHERHD